MNPSTPKAFGVGEASEQSSQEIVMRELAKLSETQKEEVLSFIHSLIGKKPSGLTPEGRKPLIPQDAQEVPYPDYTQIQQAPSEQLVQGLNPSTSDESLILIALKQFPKEKQQRLNFLVEKNTEGTITKEELSEFEELVGEAQALMLQNTETLARVIHPDLFDKKGRSIRRFLTQAVRAKASHKMP